MHIVCGLGPRPVGMRHLMGQDAIILYYLVHILFLKDCPRILVLFVKSAIYYLQIKKGSMNHGMLLSKPKDQISIT